MSSFYSILFPPLPCLILYMCVPLPYHAVSAINRIRLKEAETISSSALLICVKPLILPWYLLTFQRRKGRKKACVCMCTCAWVGVCACVCVSMCVHTRVHVYVHMCVGEVDDIESDFINHPDTDKLPMHPHTANGQPLRSVSVSCGVWFNIY